VLHTSTAASIPTPRRIKQAGLSRDRTGAAGHLQVLHPQLRLPLKRLQRRTVQGGTDLHQQHQRRPRNRRGLRRRRLRPRLRRRSSLRGHVGLQLQDLFWWQVRARHHLHQRPERRARNGRRLRVGMHQPLRLRQGLLAAPRLPERPVHGRQVRAAGDLQQRAERCIRDGRGLRRRRVRRALPRLESLQGRVGLPVRQLRERGVPVGALLCQRFERCTGERRGLRGGGVRQGVPAWGQVQLQVGLRVEGVLGGKLRHCGSQVGWLVGWLVGWSVGWLDGWDGWVGGCLGWLVGWVGRWVVGGGG